MGVNVGGVVPQVKLRLRKKNKNITLESIDKYNKNKLLKLFSDCYIYMQILEVYPGEINDAGEPTNKTQWHEWRDSHPDDIPNNFRNLVYNLVTNNIYPKLCYLYSDGYTDFPIISLLSNFCAFKSDNASNVYLEYISKMFTAGHTTLRRIEILLTPRDGFQYAKISNIQSNVVKR